MYRTGKGFVIELKSRKREQKKGSVIMKKRLSMVVSAVMIVCMVMSVNVFAASSGREDISLPKNQWVHRSGIRSGRYSYVSARVHSVYPSDGGTDNYTRIKARLISSNFSQVLSDEYTLSEKATASEQLKIYEGSLNIKGLLIQFKGYNPDLSAHAVVSYDFN